MKSLIKHILEVKRVQNIKDKFLSFNVGDKVQYEGKPGTVTKISLVKLNTPDYWGAPDKHSFTDDINQAKFGVISVNTAGGGHSVFFHFYKQFEPDPKISINQLHKLDEVKRVTLNDTQEKTIKF
jgi:hypothetical protein